MVSASTEDKAALASSFEQYKQQLKSIFTEESQTHIEKEIEKERIKLEELKLKFNNSEKLRIQAETKTIDINNQLQITEYERQRVTNAHNQLSEQLNAGLTKNNDILDLQIFNQKKN